MNLNDTEGVFILKFIIQRSAFGETYCFHNSAEIPWYLVSASPARCMSYYWVVSFQSPCSGTRRRVYFLTLCQHWAQMSTKYII